MDNIVLRWFDYVLVYFCIYIFKENDLFVVLYKMYIYVVEILGVFCF